MDYYAKTMALENQFSTTGPDGSKAMDRAKKFVYSPVTI
jgi:uncharacterized protein YkwD